MISRLSRRGQRWSKLGDDRIRLTEQEQGLEGATGGLKK